MTRDKENSKAQLFTLAASSGILLGAAFPPIPTGVTAFVGFIPFLFLLQRVKNTGQAFRYSYITFLFFNFTTVYWISGWSGDDIWLKISGVVVNLFHPLLFCVPAIIYYRINKRYSFLAGLVAFPFIWVAYEWLAQLPELSFPWLILANTQTYNLQSIQFISLTGAFGASFWIVSVNVLLFFSMTQLMKNKWSIKTKSLYFSIILVLLLIFIPKIYSSIVLDRINVQKQITIGICQPDVDPYEKWQVAEPPINKLVNLFRQYDSLSHTTDINLIIMPETAIPFRITVPGYEVELEFIKRKIDSVGIPLLTGFPDTKFYDEGTAPRSAKKFTNSKIRFDDFNSSTVVLPHSLNRTIYHKIKLTPMSERIPFLDTFPFLADALTWGVGISGWGIGHDSVVFAVPLSHHQNDTTYLWSMICYETLYPEFISTFVKRGAQFLTVITNDGWFGNTSGPYQLKQFAVLRAIENRRAIARCANNGISCFIDPYGRVSNETKLYTRTTISGTIPIISEKTFYTIHGDWFAVGCAYISVLFIVGSFFIKKNKQI